jgi:hypothetical protein
MKYSAENAFPKLLSILFLFPLFKENILSIMAIVLAINTIIFLIQKRKFKLPQKEYLFLTIPFWIVLVVSLIRFDNLEEMKPITSVLFFLILPLIFNYIPADNFTSQRIRMYLTILKNVCLFIIIYYIFSFFYNYTIYDFFIVSNNISKFRDFIYNEISVFKIHPNYFTTVLILCTAFSLHLLKNEKKWIELVYIFFFILITFLLITKINIVFIICLISYFVLFQIKGFVAQKILVLVLFLGMLSFFVKNTPGLEERIYEFTNSLTTPPKESSYNSTNIRVAIYSCDYDLVAQNFWLGTGFENIKDEIENCLNSKYDTSFYKNEKYLSHNYYLYIFISGGVFSFLIFLFYLYSVFKVVWRLKVFVLSAFFINILSVCMIEDFLYRAYGLFFFNIIVLIYFKNNQLSSGDYKEVD